MKNKLLCLIGLGCVQYNNVLLAANLTKNIEMSNNEIVMNIGEVKQIVLTKAPSRIRIINPNVVSLERVSNTNAVNITLKKAENTAIIFYFTNGKELEYKIIAKNKDKSTVTTTVPHISLNASLKLAKEIQKIQGLEAIVEDGELAITGLVNNLSDFKKLISIISSKNIEAILAYSLKNDIENSIIDFLNNKIKVLGSKTMYLQYSNGIYILSGISKSENVKNNILTFLKNILPNLSDATEGIMGDNNVIQLNLQFLEVSKGSRSESGVNHSLSNGFGTGFTFNPNSLASTFQLAPISTLAKILNEKSYFKQLAAPTVLTRSGEKAIFHAGGEIPIPGIGQIGKNDSSNQATIEYKPYGIIFEATPTLTEDKKIWLSINLEFSSIDEGVSYNNIPGFKSRKVNTNIILDTKQTAVLSGLVKQDDIKQETKIPIFSSIPIVGELFKSKKFKSDETELWIAISVLTADNYVMSYNKDINIEILKP